MRIGVEMFSLCEGKTGGLVPLIQGVLNALFAGWPQHQVVLFCTPANEDLLSNVPAHDCRLTLPATASYFPLLDAQASLLQLDVLVSTYPCEADLTFPLARRVTVIPDMQHEFFPEFFTPETLRGRRTSFRKALQGSGAIATISEHARQTLLNHPDACCRDIFIMSPALRTDWEQAELENLTEMERAQLPGVEFFLYPANLWPHKNHQRFLEAFAQFLPHAGRPVELVLTGHPEGWLELARAFPGLPVRHLGFVRPCFLRTLMAHARALTFFSLFEGFGIPLLEAFAVGTPVVCSNSTSLPEVGGDAVLACDPTDPRAMSQALLRVFNDNELCARLATQGRKRLALFDWRTSTSNLVDACARICQREPATLESSIVSLQRVNQFVLQLDADREAKQVAIEELDSACKARLATIQQLDEECKARSVALLPRPVPVSPLRKVLGMAHRMVSRWRSRVGVVDNAANDRHAA
jgi:glycosyltransferase involved in cell wall biosynthesis